MKYEKTFDKKSKTMTKLKKKIQKTEKLSKKSQIVIFVTFFPNPVKSQKYPQNHDHTTFLRNVLNR